MKTRSMIGVYGVCAAAVLSGCAAADITGPSTTLEQGPGAVTANDFASTTKTGITINYTVDANVYDHYWFSANKDASGTVSGNFLLWELRVFDKASWATVFVWGRVVCINTVGNKARVGGVVTYSSFDGIPVGSALTWSVTDNGTKGASSDDTASALFGVADPYAYCAAGLAYPETSAIQGGVKIQ